MKTWIAVVALTLFGAVLFAAPLAAQMGKEEPKKAEPVEEPPPASSPDVMFKDCDKVIGTVTITAADIKAFNDNWVEAYKTLKADKKYVAAENKSVKEAFDCAVKMESFIKWAKDKKLDADSFLRKCVRVILFHANATMVVPGLEKGRKELADAEKECEENKAAWGEEKYNLHMKEIKAKREIYDNAEKAWKQVGDPTADEKKALDADKTAIQKTLDSAEGNEEGDDKDGK